MLSQMKHRLAANKEAAGSKKAVQKENVMKPKKKAPIAFGKALFGRAKGE